MFEVFEHTADIGLRIRARTLPDLFADAARGLFSLLVENPEAIEPKSEWSCHLQADQLDLLLFDWLNELLYRFDCEHWLMTKFAIQIEGTSLTARCHGEPLDLKRHRLDHEVKAITYHDLKLEATADGYLAEVILDI